MISPANLVYRFLQDRSRVSVWLYENVNTRIEGHIVGYDEYMNIVLDDAAEVHIKRGMMKKIGKILLKGDNVALIQSMDGKPKDIDVQLLHCGKQAWNLDDVVKFQAKADNNLKQIVLQIKLASW